MVETAEKLSNVTLNSTSPLALCTGEEPSKLTKTTTYAVLMIMSLVGNLFVVVVFYWKKSFRTPVHFFIVNMAISDLVIPVIFLPQQIVEAYNDCVWLEDGAVDHFLCKFVRVSVEVSFTVSVLSMGTIAVDRFYAIVFAFKPALITRKTCLRIIVVIWITSNAFRAHTWYGYRLIKDDAGVHCVFQWGSASESIAVQNIADIIWVLLTFVSAIVLTVLYSSISIYLYRQKNNIRLASKIIQQRAKENRKITFMLATVVVVFYVVWFPFNMLIILFNLPGGISVSCFSFWMVLYVFPILYPVLNPIIYFVFNEKYRQGMRELLCWPCNKCTRCHQGSVPPPAVIPNVGDVAQQDNFGAELENTGTRERQLSNEQPRPQCHPRAKISDSLGTRVLS